MSTDLYYGLGAVAGIAIMLVIAMLMRWLDRGGPVVLTKAQLEALPTSEQKKYRAMPLDDLLKKQGHDRASRRRIRAEWRKKVKRETVSR